MKKPLKIVKMSWSPSSIKVFDGESYVVEMLFEVEAKNMANDQVEKELGAAVKKKCNYDVISCSVIPSKK